MGEMEWGKKRLSPIIIVFWSVRGITLTVFAAALVSYAGFMYNPDVPFYTVLAAILGITCYIMYQVARYYNYYYILEKDGLMIHRGVFNTRRTVIPYSKIQDVSTSRSVFQQLFECESLKIETAGRRLRESEGVLPFVPDYKRAVEEIRKRRDIAVKRFVDHGT